MFSEYIIDPVGYFFRFFPQLVKNKYVRASLTMSFKWVFQE